MPELPEVETTRRGIAPWLEGQCVEAVVVRNPQLRWPVTDELCREAAGARIEAVERRAKYLLIRTDRGTLIIHLGMSGSLRVAGPEVAPEKHDHVDLLLGSGRVVRYRDPRRFGFWLWLRPGESSPLLERLGPEPLDAAFDGDYLAEATKGRRTAIKTLLMDAKVVVGVGNIYANEALFLAGIDPRRPAGRISRDRLERLADEVKAVLRRAIEAGGTTLKDFVSSDGRPGYFRQQLHVYGREGEPCVKCGTAIKRLVVGQRATYICARCQR